MAAASAAPAEGATAAREGLSLRDAHMDVDFFVPFIDDSDFVFQYETSSDLRHTRRCIITLLNPVLVAECAKLVRPLFFAP